MYESYFHLKEQPFGATPDPRFLFRSHGHRKALEYLAYGVFRKRGFLALTGEVGVGKTTVVRAFIHAFQPSLDVSFLLNTNVNFEEMLYLILHDFGCNVEPGSKVEMLNALNDLMIKKYAENRNPLIVIDEAQNLGPEVMEELRMLSNLETDSEKLLQIVLVGQPELEELLRRRELRQLRQRIPGILRIQSLHRDEVEGYIFYRLRAAGMSNGHLRFTEGASEAIFERSEGIPRLINVICDRALMLGYRDRATIIDEGIVDRGVKDLWYSDSYDRNQEPS